MHQSPDKHLFIHSGVYDLELRMFESGTKDVFCVIARDATSEVQIDRLKDELIGIAAHELKTPLAGVRMAAECLVKRFRTQRVKRRPPSFGKRRRNERHDLSLAGCCQTSDRLL